MNELLAAAKAVIDYEKDHSYNFADRVAALRAAVERAEQGAENEPYLYLWEGETIDTHRKIRIILDEPRFPPGVVSDIPIIPLYRHPPRPTGLDKLLEQIRFLEQQIAERKNA